MAEWFKAAVLKTAEGSNLPWVRIPLSPPEARALAKLMDADRALMDQMRDSVGMQSAAMVA